MHTTTIDRYFPMFAYHGSAHNSCRFHFWLPQRLVTMSGAFGASGSNDLFFKTAEGGKWSYFYSLVSDSSTSKKSSNFSRVDDKGRNILHIALVSKNRDVIRGLYDNRNNSRFEYTKLLQTIDCEGRNVLHQAVLMNDENILEICLLVPMCQSNVDDIVLQCDNKGRTAQDYAIMFKRSSKMLSILNSFTFSTRYRLFEEEFAHTNPNTDELVFDLIVKHLNVVKGSLDDVHISPLVTKSVCSLLNDVVMKNYVKCVKFFIESEGWNFPTRMLGDSNSYILDGTNLCVRNLWPNTEYDPDAETNGPQFNEGDYRALHDELYMVCEDWDITAQTFEDFLLSKQIPDSFDDFTGRYRYDVPSVSGWYLLLRMRVKEGNEIFQWWLQQLLDTIQLTQRPEVLEYLLDKADQRLLSQTRPFLETLVFNGHLPTLQWYVDRYWVNLQGMVRDDAVGWKFANVHKWMFDAAGNVEMNVRWCEYLSVVALLGFHTISLFIWLYEQCPDPQFTVGGKSVLQFAILHTKGLHVRYLIETHKFSLQDLTPSDIAFISKNREMFSSEYLANLLGLKRDEPVHRVEYISSIVDDKKSLTRLRGDSTASQVADPDSFPAIVIQSCYRRHKVYLKYKHYLGVNHNDWLRFREVWLPVSQLLQTGPPRQAPSWEAVHRVHAMVVADQVDSKDMNVFVEAITSAAAVAIEQPHLASTVPRADHLNTVVTTVPATTTSEEANEEITTKQQACLENIEVTASVVKWFASADGQYKKVFLQRLSQLAEGQRSYALSKRLQHSGCPIYETKLDSGMRILWTNLKRDEKSSILVWFVSKHDDVSQYADLIESSCRRQSVPLRIVNGAEVDAALELSESDVLIDPAGNTPLKAYATTRTEISADQESIVREWKPLLRLSSRQQQVNGEIGTVLLLGRSGTGKTICICDRMIADRSRSIAPIRQLFVCRSKKLCEFVRQYQQQYADASSILHMHFMTLASFTSQMNINVKMNHGPSVKLYSDAAKVDFVRFESQLFPKIRGKCTVVPIVVWLHIRSFIKGSVEAVVQRHPLALEQYSSVEMFTLDRCRLTANLRKEVYAIYLRYEDVLKTQGLWDDADYTLDLLTRSKLEALSTQYDKVYVDEVQDNTQAEIVLYFLAAGMNTQSLFLAGDPAQSVVEGVDFRFEDVRSIVHKLSGGKFGIGRAMKLATNYRSHSGILNCASAVLDKMFAMFPGAATVLPKDVGLFKGPRPACCQVDGFDGLARLLRKNERLVVLCADEDVKRVESELNRVRTNNIVLGIRAAKGLEFQDVVLLNAFSGLPPGDHAVWKSLFTTEHPTTSSSHPQVELQLKLLYVAVTRSVNRLLFVETEKTQLSSVMFRWMVGTGLAEIHNAADESTVLMTSDEWRVQGIDFALSAEGENTVTLLENAVKCFDLSGDSVLSNRATAQLEIANVLKKTRNREAGGKLSLREEHDAAHVVVRGLKQGLVVEVKVLCDALWQKLHSSSIFNYEILYKLNKV